MDREEYQSERAFYLEAFNGDGSFTFDRIGRGTVHIPCCTLSMIGGIQPSRISSLVAEAAYRRHGSDGLLQRFQLAVWPDEPINWDWVTIIRTVKLERPTRKRFGIFVSYAFVRGCPTIFRFSAAAQPLFQSWMEELHREARSGQFSPALESHILKMPKTVASLALIFELVDGGRFEVGSRL